jgi:hypothetical protein
MLAFIIKQGIGKCNKGVFATNADADGLLTYIRIYFVSNLDFGSFFILL